MILLNYLIAILSSFWVLGYLAATYLADSPYCIQRSPKQFLQLSESVQEID